MRRVLLERLRDLPMVTKLVGGNAEAGIPDVWFQSGAQKPDYKVK